MRAVDRSERIVDIAAAVVLAAGELSQRRGELRPVGGVLGGLAGIEPDVFQQQQVAIAQPGRHQPGTFTHRVQRELDRTAQQLGEPVSYRAQ